MENIHLNEQACYGQFVKGTWYKHCVHWNHKDYHELNFLYMSFIRILSKASKIQVTRLKL